MHILIVDDHPMTVEGYTHALSKNAAAGFLPIFSKAHSCEEAYETILLSAEENKPFDLILLDHGLPGFEAKELHSGSDIVPVIRKQLPDCKIIMITAHTEVLIVYEIIKNVRPDGLIIKNDVNPDNLPLIVQEVMRTGQYQSPMVKKCINEIWKRELMIEDFNRQILLYLSKGFKIRELEETICLSHSGIQKRIAKMKLAFEVTDDSGLIRKAVSEGFI